MSAAEKLEARSFEEGMSRDERQRYAVLMTIAARQSAFVFIALTPGAASSVAGYLSDRYGARNWEGLYGPSLLHVLQETTGAPYDPDVWRRGLPAKTDKTCRRDDGGCNGACVPQSEWEKARNWERDNGVRSMGDVMDLRAAAARQEGTRCGITAAELRARIARARAEREVGDGG